MAGKRDKRHSKNGSSTTHQTSSNPKMRKNPLSPFRLPQRSLMQVTSSYADPKPIPLTISPIKWPAEAETSSVAPQDLFPAQPSNDFMGFASRSFTQDKECCGNFLIQDLSEDTLQLWMLGQHLKATLTQISIYNSSSSTGAVEVSALGDEVAVFVVQPGNTSTFTGTDIRKVSICFKGGRSSYIEGKYCISSSIWVRRPPCPDEDCDFE
jgi:hypothetical protein